MNRKISKIITGISILLCLGIFLPSQSNAMFQCRGASETECAAYGADCMWKPAGCKNYGRGTSCQPYNQKDCVTHPECQWNIGLCTYQLDQKKKSTK